MIENEGYEDKGDKQQLILDFRLIFGVQAHSLAGVYSTKKLKLKIVNVSLNFEYKGKEGDFTFQKKNGVSYL